MKITLAVIIVLSFLFTGATYHSNKNGYLSELNIWIPIEIHGTDDVINNSLLKLLYFKAECINDNTTQFIWETSYEINNTGFIIEKSIDGINFENIIELKTVNHNNGFIYIVNYDLLDFSYYRLKQIGINKKCIYSDIVLVECDSEVINSIKIYPNPTNGNIIIISEINLPYIIDIFDYMDRCVLHEKVNSSEINIDMSKYNVGIYYCRIILDKTVVYNKIVKF